MHVGKDYINSLKTEFQGYSGASLMKDLMAGLTVSAVALPLALAFGVSSGADAASGLITAIIAGLIMSLLSGAFYQISGPTGAMSAILISVVARYGMQGVFLATLMAGAMLILAGVLHLGKLTAFIPMPVITGFTSGIAVIIALGQVDNFFGVRSEGDSAVAKLLSYGQLGFSPNWTALAIAAFVVLFLLLFPKKWGAVVPPSLLAIIIATAIAMIMGLDVPAVGEIPKTLLPESRLSISGISYHVFADLISPAFSIAMLGMIESLLCGASASRMTGVRLLSDQELIAQGVGNMLVPFFGGIPATAAIARTSVAIKSGARTRLTGVFHALGLLAAMFALGPVMSRIPLSALAGVLMVTAWRMNDWETIRYFFKGRFKGPIVKFLVTMGATILFDLTAAIAIGVALALVLLVSRLSRLEIAYDRVDFDRLGIADEALARRYANTMVAYITGPLLFANTQIVEEIKDHLDGCDTLLMSMRGVPHLDISGAQAMMDLVSELQAKRVDVMLCGVSGSVREMMDRTGFTVLVGESSFYWSATRALSDLRPHMQTHCVK